jgi:hypothetical protein
MDVPQLHPSNLARPDSAAGAIARGRDRRTGTTSGMTAGVAPPFAGDRIERTAELETKLIELRQALDRAPESHPVDLEALREEIAKSRLASRETLLRAAAGILHGELFFQQQA